MCSSEIFVQDLSVLVTSDLKEGEIELVEDEHAISIVDTHAFSDDQVRLPYNIIF